MADGPIAALKDGDLIKIDIPSRRLSVDLDDDEIRARIEKARKPERNVRGWLARYRKMATSADTGAVLR